MKKIFKRTLKIVILLLFIFIAYRFASDIVQERDAVYQIKKAFSTGETRIFVKDIFPDDWDMILLAHEYQSVHEAVHRCTQKSVPLQYTIANRLFDETVSNGKWAIIFIKNGKKDHLYTIDNDELMSANITDNARCIGFNRKDAQFERAEDYIPLYPTIRLVRTEK